MTTTAAGRGADQAAVDALGRLITVVDELNALISGEDQAFDVIKTVNGGSEYETVAAGQTDQVLGATGGVGDYLESLLLTVGAGSAITVKDGATTIFTYTFGAAVTTGPVLIPIKARSVSGAWKITTGASLTALATGVFL